MKENNQEGILKFNLEDPYARNAFVRAQKATDFYIAMTDFDNNSLRQRVKYEDLDEKSYELVEAIRSEFFQLLEEYNIDLWGELE